MWLEEIAYRQIIIEMAQMWVGGSAKEEDDACRYKKYPAEVELRKKRVVLMGKVFASMRHGGARLAVQAQGIIIMAIMGHPAIGRLASCVGRYCRGCWWWGFIRQKEIQLRIIMIIIVSNALLIPLSLTPVI